MKAEGLQSIELLSLEVRGGRRLLGLSVDWDTEQTNIYLEVDEITYHQLLSIEPSSADRIRLSLYASWDPFRQSHFSSLVKTSQTLSETYYFNCTHTYMQQIESIRRGESLETVEYAPAAEETVKEMVPMTRSKPVRSSGPARMSRLLASTLRLLVLMCLFYVLWFEWESRVLFDGADALSESQVLPIASLDQSATGAVTTRQSEHIVLAHSEENNQSEESVEGNEDTDKVPGEEPTAAERVNAEFAQLIEIETGQSYYSLPQGYVGLTFDDGPSPLTNDIVDVLIEHEVAATFLFVGKHTQKYGDGVAYAAEHGMAVGNHSWNHSDLTKLKSDQVKSNIEDANGAIERYLEIPSTVFRPPYGALDEQLADTVSQLGMKMLMWNRDPKDWQADSANEILQYFKKMDPSGGIYVLHEKKATLEALPAIITYLKEQGLTFAIFQ